ncbi:MAG: gas vesicle protein GvpG [Acidobacteriia bacterium]|nr:gas vesicle protein GvpG [Terriglobia bacterium]
MFLIDDILVAPARGVLWIFEEIHKAAEEELANESESITAQLRNLYLQLETDAITEKEFDTAEKILLDRLDAIEERRKPKAHEPDEELAGKP